MREARGVDPAGVTPCEDWQLWIYKSEPKHFVDSLCPECEIELQRRLAGAARDVREGG